MATVTTQGAVAIETFRAEGDGCLGYLVVDEASGAALAIDPRFDQVTAFQAALGARGAHLAYVIDTHTHADHLSGARLLARRTGATVLAHAASKLRHPARRVTPEATLQLGATTVAVLDARGHTPDSLALLAGEHLFTGDALFVGGAGRTDFMGGSAAELFDTFRRFEALPDATVVHPGHDYVGRAVSTIGEEKRDNPLLRERDRAAFVARLAGSAAPPANMAAILRHNLGEADAATVAPREVQARLGEGDLFLLDVRSQLEFAGERIDGAVNVPLEALDAHVDQIPEQADVVVVCRTGVRAAIAAEALARAGRRPRVLEGGVLAWRRAGLPLRVGRRRLPVDRQVQLIAGSMVLAGVVLGTLVNPWFLGLAAFFGAGLTFAGATGTCGLALLLMKMPWNRAADLPPVGVGAVCAAGGAATCATPASPAR
jgi:glyoxylase-like metal-dependent hydrolase (beta-lactamase superfamily II)/rhodanese-related sulfurtransferase